MLVMHVPLRFLEPAALGNALLLLDDRPRFLLRLCTRDSNDHDGDGQHCKQPH